MTEKDIIANLIANMIEQGANREEFDRVIKYSMVVMDAMKDYSIEELRIKYLNCRIPCDILCEPYTRSGEDE